MCSLCMLSAANLNDMAFDEEELAGFGGTGMEQQSHVGIDKKSGQIEGWDSIWAILKLEDEERKMVEGTQIPKRPDVGRMSQELLKQPDA